MREVLAVVYREYLIRRTSPTWLFFDLAVPLLYLLMFGVAFDKALGHGLRIGEATVPYNAFFLGGVLSMSSFGSAMNQSYGFFVDRDNGIFYEFLTSSHDEGPVSARENSLSMCHGGDPMHADHRGGNPAPGN